MYSTVITLSIIVLEYENKEKNYRSFASKLFWAMAERHSSSAASRNEVIT